MALAENGRQSRVIFETEIVEDLILDDLVVEVRHWILVDKPDIVAAAGAGQRLDVLGDDLFLQQQSSGEFVNVDALSEDKEASARALLREVDASENHGKRAENDASNLESRHGGTAC